MTLNEELIIAGEFQRISHMTFPFLLQAVANLALVIWDILLTLEEEVFFLYSTRRTTFVKVLFCVVRYLALILQFGTVLFLFGSQYLKDDVCPAFIWYITVLGMVVTACANLLFIHRVFAFYERNRQILFFLGSVFAITETLVVIVIGLAIPKFRLVKNPLPAPFTTLVGDCVSGPYPSTIAYLWLSELIFQSIAFACVIARFTYMQIVASKDGIPAPRLYTIFLRDGIWVYFFLFLTYLLNVIFSTHPSYSGLITALWSFTATSICCSRLILNLNSSVLQKNRRLSCNFNEEIQGCC